MCPRLIQDDNGPSRVTWRLLKDLIEEVTTCCQHEPVNHKQATLTGQRCIRVPLLWEKQYLLENIPFLLLLLLQVTK